MSADVTAPSNPHQPLTAKLTREGNGYRVCDDIGYIGYVERKDSRIWTTISYWSPVTYYHPTRKEAVAFLEEAAALNNA